MILYLSNVTVIAFGVCGIIATASAAESARLLSIRKQHKRLSYSPRSGLLERGFSFVGLLPIQVYHV
jgi:hypothetical protein